jgi:hypothetical protein
LRSSKVTCRFRSTMSAMIPRSLGNYLSYHKPYLYNSKTSQPSREACRIQISLPISEWWGNLKGCSFRVYFSRRIFVSTVLPGKLNRILPTHQVDFIILQCGPSGGWIRSSSQIVLRECRDFCGGEILTLHLLIESPSFESAEYLLVNSCVL